MTSSEGGGLCYDNPIELLKRTKLAKGACDNVVARSQELGLPGKPPAVTIFEDENSSGNVG